MAHAWHFSPDGSLLAVPLMGEAKIVQLWEVGSTDHHGVPQFRLITELRPQDKRAPAPPNLPSTFAPYLNVAWTPDSKTLIARYNRHGSPLESQILFWSFTDKPSVLSDAKDEDRGAKSWKPWAKLAFDDHVDFAVSPDNRTLAVIEHWLRPANGYLFDLETAALREKFDFDRDRNVKDPNLGDGGCYVLQFSPDSKTLLIDGHRYFGLWNTTPPAPRIEMRQPDFKETLGERHPSFHSFAFTTDSRWLLISKVADSKDVLRRQGGLVQVRDVETGESRREVGFPSQLGLMYSLRELPDHRVLLRFHSRKGHRHFLWHTDDLFR